MLNRFLVGAFVLSLGASAFASYNITFNTEGAASEPWAIYYGTTSKGSAWAGVLEFTDNSSGHPFAGEGGDTNGGNKFYTVCGDIFDDISGGSTYDVNASWTAGNSHPTIDYSLAGSILYAFTNNATYEGGSTGNNLLNIANGVGVYSRSDIGAALQLAVWEALYDGYSETSVTSLNFMQGDSTHRGNFSVGTGGPNSANVLSLASILFNNGVAGLTDPNQNAILLAATPGGSGQDQITIGDHHGFVNPTPEPFTMSLGIGAAGLFIRRKLKAKKA